MYEYVYEYGRKSAVGGAFHVLVHANLFVICAPTAGFGIYVFVARFQNAYTDLYLAVEGVFTGGGYERDTKDTAGVLLPARRRLGDTHYLSTKGDGQRTKVLSGR